jgi:exodeoxyribonuclease V alpha subunit
VTYENEQTSFRVIKVSSVEGQHSRRGEIAIVGVFQAVGPGTRVRVTGEFINDPRHGEQFRAQSLVPLEPSTLNGLERYLGSGLIPGVGPGFAKRIVSVFGMDSLKILDSEPERLREIPGLGARRVEEIRKKWASQRAISNVMMLLQTHGASPALAARIWKHYGERAAQIVQRSPYRLALDVQGVGFKTADRIARSLGIAGDHPERAQAGVLHQLGLLAEQGHLFGPRIDVVELAREMLSIEPDHVEAAIDTLYASERVVVDGDAVYLARYHRAECDTARQLYRLLETEDRSALRGVDEAIAIFERKRNLELAPAQRQAVWAAASHKVVAITGGPGVGKTTIVRALLHLFERSRFAVRLCAPTGRAAKRMSETTGHEATTIHRLLEFEPRSALFQRNAQRRLEGDVVIVDEASMIDIPLAAALLQAIPTKGRLVIVGDADQLPSVGPGAFLRDVLASKLVKSVFLTEIFRQAEQSRIVQNAHRILHGEMPKSAPAEEPNADFFVVSRSEPEQAKEVIRELVAQRIPRRFGFHPLSDIQVLTPMHRGPAGTQQLNTMLQSVLNPHGDELESRGQLLRRGDKVMQTKNDYDREVYNGDLGVIESVDMEERVLKVNFDGRHKTYEDHDLDALVLAYATSIHKSQGSEYSAVVVPLLTTHFVMLSRHLLYTAVTRAKRLCVLVADPRALRLAIAETRREDRMTRLAERLGSLRPERL